MEKKKLYCSGIKDDTIFGVKLTECCKKHDNDSGQAGDYKFHKHAVCFYKCLRTKLSMPKALLITIGGTVFVILKLPYLLYKKIKYKRQQND